MPQSTVPLELFAQIVQVSADAVFSEDRDGLVTSWNAAAERLYGRPAALVMGRPAQALFPPETGAELAALRRRAAAGEPVYRFDTWHRRPDGERRAVSMAMAPLFDASGAAAGLATSAQDVTEQERLAAVLADTHRELAEHDAALARSNRDLEQFAYIASHDLSEPLRAITGFGQLLEQRCADALDERGLRYLEHVVDGAARMRTLIDDLLEYSRFLRTDSPCGAVDAGAIARRVAEALGADQVEVGDVPAVWADESTIGAVLTNLVSNALKFHRPGVAARVVVSGSREGSQVRLDVDDDGIGIAPEYRDRVFRMFARLHVREAYDGTGIGLAIVRQIAERAGGRAWVEDSPLGGARLSITLPGVPA